MEDPSPSKQDSRRSGHVHSIRFLTSFVHGFCVDKAAPTGTRKNSGAIEPFVHLANLFDLGDSSFTGLAVTGAVRAHSTEVAIVISSNSGTSQATSCRVPRDDDDIQPPPGTKPFDIVTLNPSSLQSVDLTDPPNSAPGIQRHAEDLLAVFTNKEKLNIKPSTLYPWIVFRCFRKLAHRIQMATKEWEDGHDPIADMKKWEPSNNEPSKLWTPS
ncbi:hypothetical protein OF83DRAFT_632883 [Amylostereum chailletii]|nr:hypothetical protein OF83DRAFT_632883 [Amylostereum chailletii]